MEQPIIILIDMQTRQIRLYGKITKVIPFSLAFLIPPILDKERIIYVSDYVEASPEDVSECIASVLDANVDQIVEPLFLVCNQDGYTKIPELQMKFAGKKDVKSLESVGYDCFDRSPTLSRLYKEGVVDVLTARQIDETKRNKRAKLREKADDSIIIKGNSDKIVDKFFEQLENGGGTDDGAQWEEVTGEGRIETEEERLVRQTRRQS